MTTLRVYGPKYLLSFDCTVLDSFRAPCIESSGLEDVGWALHPRRYAIGPGEPYADTEVELLWCRATSTSRRVLKLLRLSCIPSALKLKKMVRMTL